MIQDMTKGNALKLILLFSLPILIGNVFQQLYQLADIFIVGRLLGENRAGSRRRVGSDIFYVSDYRIQFYRRADSRYGAAVRGRGL